MFPRGNQADEVHRREEWRRTQRGRSDQQHRKIATYETPAGPWMSGAGGVRGAGRGREVGPHCNQTDGHWSTAPEDDGKQRLRGKAQSPEHMGPTASGQPPPPIPPSAPRP